MSEPTFGEQPTHVSDAGLEVTFSPDRLAVTITCAGVEAHALAAQPVPIATRELSVVLPAEGLGDGVQVSFRIDGFALVTDGAAALCIVAVNGSAGVQRLRPGHDGEFVQEVTADVSGASQTRLSAFLVAERDSALPDAEARLNILSIDAEFSQPAAAA